MDKKLLQELKLIKFEECKECGDYLPFCVCTRLEALFESVKEIPIVNTRNRK